MNDKELCEFFGTTLEDVEREVAAVEDGDVSAFDFDSTLLGRPIEEEKMETISLKVPHSRIVAMERMASEQGVSRSELVRRAIDRELLAHA